jgi:SAM-dependent methyltransferase
MTGADDTRPPSHFAVAYAGAPPWDIGRPQSAIVALADRGDVLRGPLLDVGCGTGEHVIFLRQRGVEAWGVDVAAAAIERAREKAAARGVAADVLSIGDALALGELGRTFTTVLDSGVFHIFSDADRARYAASLASVVRPGGTFVTLVFSDREPAEWGGPRRIRARDFGDTFRAGWRVRSIEASRFETTFAQHAEVGGGDAWLAVVERLAD